MTVLLMHCGRAKPTYIGSMVVKEDLFRFAIPFTQGSNYINPAVHMYQLCAICLSETPLNKILLGTEGYEIAIEFIYPIFVLVVHSQY